MTGGLLVLDFDGTLWRGTEPLLYYAEAVASGLSPLDRPAYLARVRAFLAGDRWATAGSPASPPDDGWAAVAQFAAELGIEPSHRQKAFLEARERITAGAFRLDVPEGLQAFLRWSRRWCTVVLASNSPAWSVAPVLERLGFASLFDDVASDAGKPDALQRLVGTWAERFEVPSGRIMSVGDHYRNDIDPAARAGWFTTYITPWRWVPGPCSLVGTTMEEVLPELRAWVTAVAADGATAEGEVAQG